MTVTPNAAGEGSVTFSDASIKAYDDHGEILTGVNNASFTITEAGPNPSPTYSMFTIDSLMATYSETANLTGTKSSSIAKIFVNESDANSSYPTSTSWSASVELELGANEFTVYGEDGSEIATEEQTITVNRHTLGDINGDGNIDLIDASLFAVDWGKTENLTYNLSDMNGDGEVNLTDLSVLAKLQE